MMTLDQFFEHLEQAVKDRNLTFRKNIRDYFGKEISCLRTDDFMCPITAVYYHLKGKRIPSYFVGGCELGLTAQDRQSIVHAADNDNDSYIRRKLEQITGANNVKAVYT